MQSIRTPKQETVLPKEEKKPEPEIVQPVSAEKTEPVIEPKPEKKSEPDTEPAKETKNEPDDSDIIKFYTGYDDNSDGEEKGNDKEIVIKDHKKKTESLSFGDRLKRSLGKFFSGEVPEDEDEDEEL